MEDSTHSIAINSTEKVLASALHALGEHPELAEAIQPLIKREQQLREKLFIVRDSEGSVPVVVGIDSDGIGDEIEAFMYKIVSKIHEGSK